MRLLGLIWLAAAIPLSAVVLVVADAHAWSDSATQLALSGVFGGMTAVDILFPYWKAGRLRIGRRSRRQTRRIS
jgi:hypothetical protein